MKQLPVLFFLVFIFQGFKVAAAVTLSAITRPGQATVTLQWNMVNYPGATTYTLFKSMDGITWVVSAANPVYRNYNASTILAYHDNFSEGNKRYYRVKIYDTNANIVDISNTATVENPKNSSPVENPSVIKTGAANVPSTVGRNVWQVYPNPVGDVLTLFYKGKDAIRGVINIVILDATGKAVIRFRAASNNRQLHIQVSNLHAGLYVIKINVFNEIQLNEKFLKQ